MATKSISTQGGKSVTRNKTILFEFGLGATPQSPAVNDETLRVALPFNCIFSRWTFCCAEVPSGANAVVDIFLDGISIFAVSLAAKAVFPDSGSGLAADNTFATVGGSKDQLIYAKVLQVGTSTPSTSPGKGYTVALEIE